MVSDIWRQFQADTSQRILDAAVAVCCGIWGNASSVVTAAMCSLKQKQAYGKER